MQKIDKLKLAEAENYMLAAIVRQQASVEIYTAALPVVESFRDKPVSKRIATAIQAALPQYRVFYSPDYHGWRRVSISGAPFNYDNQITLDFTKPAEYLVVKTEKESVERVIESLKAWKENAIASIEILKKEHARLKEMIDAHLTIENEYQKARAAFNQAYGTESRFGTHEISYTAREAIKIVTGDMPER